MDIEAHRPADEVLGHLKTFCQFPDFGTAFGNGIVQFLHRDQRLDGPFVGPVLVPLTVINGRMDIVKTSGDTMPQLMT